MADRTRFYTVQTIQLTFVILLLLTLTPGQLGSVCGPSDSGYQGYSFIQPNTVDIAAGAAPFFLPFKEISSYYMGQEKIQTQDNVSEWYQRFCNEVPKTDIDYLVYLASEQEIENLLIDASQDKPGISDVAMLDNAFARHLVEQKCVEVLKYLLFAKQCQPHVTAQSNAWEEPVRNKSEMSILIKKGVDLFKKTKSDYIKLRYAYQIIRLAHYAKEYERVLSLYDYLMPKIQSAPSILTYWITGHKAGALIKLGQRVEAAYLYSLVFENCPSKRESAYQSFSIRSDEEWEACIKLCQSSDERATLFALRASDPKSRPLPEMQAIYEINPQNRHLETLLVREILKLEKQLLGVGFNKYRRENKKKYGIPEKWAFDYIIDLQDFVQKILAENKMARKELWEISLGYLQLLAGNYYDAGKSFNKVRSMTTDPAISEQLRVFESVLQICSFQDLTPEVEEKAGEIMGQEVYTTYADFPSFLHHKMINLCEQRGEIGKAILLDNGLADLKINPNMAIIDQMLAICEKPNPTSLERRLVRKFENKSKTIKEDLLDMKVVAYMQDGNWEEAKQLLAKIPRSEWAKYKGPDPFVENLSGRVDFMKDDTTKFISRGDVVTRINFLLSDIRIHPDSVELYYELGNGLYNISYFGHAWKQADYYRGYTSMQAYQLRDGDDVVSSYQHKLGNKENFDVSGALYYFEKTRNLAGYTDLGVKAAFMAARCERDDYYVKRFKGKKRGYFYFEQLKNNYADKHTTYFPYFLYECKTLSWYVNR